MAEEVIGEYDVVRERVMKREGNGGSFKGLANAIIILYASPNWSTGPSPFILSYHIYSRSCPVSYNREIPHQS